MIQFEWRGALAGLAIFGVILGGYKIYYNQGFVCNKTKNICYSTICGIKSSKKIKITELSSITIVKDKKKNHKSKTTTEDTDVYMPTLIPKQGAGIPIYNSPTKNAQKALKDKEDLIYYMRHNDNEMNLKNTDNFIWLF